MEISWSQYQSTFEKHVIFFWCWQNKYYFSIFISQVRVNNAPWYKAKKNYATANIYSFVIYSLVMYIILYLNVAELPTFATWL